MKKGYDDAIELARQRLAELEPEEVCARTGARWQDGIYYIPWFGQERALDTGNTREIILWHHYLLGQGQKQTSGDWIAFRDIPGGAMFYESTFLARSVQPLVRCFGNCPDALLTAGLKLGGEKAKAGDVAITLWPFPYLPITYLLWAAEADLPPDGNILFDRTCVGWMSVEDLVVLASEGAYKLIALCGKQ